MLCLELAEAGSGRLRYEDLEVKAVISLDFGGAFLRGPVGRTMYIHVLHRHGNSSLAMIGLLLP